mgnify:CR=1 FL=1
MTQQEYDRIVAALDEECSKIEAAKRPAYTGGDKDVLKNFKHVAERLGITPMQAWGIYFLKHIDSITSAAKDPSIPQAEPLVGRFADAKIYLSLGWALWVETQAELAQQSSTEGQNLTLYMSQDPPPPTPTPVSPPFHHDGPTYRKS